MSCLFQDLTRTDFSGIENWDVSKVKDMRYMFAGCESFNQDISSWDVSKVENMDWMFAYCKSFNQNISGWNTGKVESMFYMFEDCPISNLNKPTITEMEENISKEIKKDIERF